MQLPWRSLHPPVRRPAPDAWLPSATACLLAAQVAVFLVQWGWRATAAHAHDPVHDPLLASCGVTWAGLRAWHLWQPWTALFVSGGAEARWLLPCNWLLLALAGRPLEAVIGRRHLVQLFLLAGGVGELAQATANWAAHGPDLPVGGGTAANAGIFFALACVLPRAALLPGVAGGRFKVVHGAAGAALVLTVLAAAGTPSRALALGSLAGGLTGCLSMRALGFGRRKPQPETLPIVATVPAAIPLQAVGGGKLSAPRFTEREQRMTPREYISEQIDPILEKISRQGIGSLTAAERRVLDKGREKISGGL